MKNKKIKKNKKAKATAQKKVVAKKFVRKLKGRKIKDAKIPTVRVKKKNKSSLAMRAAGTIKLTKGAPVLKRADRQSLGMGKLLLKGKERGYVTFDEILKEFPTIEEDIIFLDELYEKLSGSGVDILEGGGLLETPSDE